MTGRWLLPEGVDRVVLPLLVGKALRAFADGYVAVLLPAYLLALGFGTLDVGILSTATLLGSAFATLAVGAWGHRFHHRNLLLGAALLMLGTGLSFAFLSAFLPLLLVAFVGTLNPSSGDVSVFCPSNMPGWPSRARVRPVPPCSPVTPCWEPYLPRWGRWPPAFPSYWYRCWGSSCYQGSG